MSRIITDELHRQVVEALRQARRSNDEFSRGLIDAAIAALHASPSASMYAFSEAAGGAAEIDSVAPSGACAHRRYSLDTKEQIGYCIDCGAEGRMTFVVPASKAQDAVKESGE